MSSAALADEGIPTDHRPVHGNPATGIDEHGTARRELPRVDLGHTARAANCDGPG